MRWKLTLPVLLMTAGVAWAALSGPTLVAKSPLTVKWEELASNTGTAYAVPGSCRSLLIHHFGNFGGTLSFHGSADGTRYDLLLKQGGLSANTTGAGWTIIEPCPRFIRPSSASNVDVDAVLIVH